jgi:hypothetical protein
VRPSPKNLLDLLLAGELFIVAIGKDKRKFICTQNLLKIYSKAQFTSMPSSG